MRVYTLYSNMIDVLPNNQLELLKGNSTYLYSEEKITFKWQELSVIIHQMNDELSVRKQISALLSIVDMKTKVRNLSTNNSLIQRINETKSVYGIEITPDVDNRVNDLISTICVNTNCLILSGDTLFDENINEII
ncbi:MAG: hypothetical protein GY787_32875 [Alteromonadales bacterium]|nr:hypothetical protein [Alteromonadales bacterium]